MTILLLVGPLILTCVLVCNNHYEHFYTLLSTLIHHNFLHSFRTILSLIILLFSRLHQLLSFSFLVFKQSHILLTSGAQLFYIFFILFFVLHTNNILDLFPTIVSLIFLKASIFKYPIFHLYSI